MKPLLVFLVPLLCVSGLFAAVHITVIPIQREKSELKKLPVIVRTAAEKNGDVTFTFALAEFSDPNLTFDAYDLRVISRPVAQIDLEKDYYDLGLIEKKERTRKPTASFTLKKAEIAKAYFIVGFWKKSEAGRLISYTIPAALMTE